MTDKKNCFAGQNIKSRVFGKMLFLCAALFFTVVIFTQCDWTAEAEFVRGNIHNKTGEALDVATGKMFISVIIPAGGNAIVAIVKDKSISAIGKTSGKTYETRRFYRNNESWTVNP